MNPPSGGAGTRVVVSFISTTGCSIECEDSGLIGKKCELYFDWKDLQLGLQAQVVWRREGKAGLRFHAVDEDLQSRLNELCKGLLIKPPSAREATKQESAPPPFGTPTAAYTGPELPPHAFAAAREPARQTIRESDRRRVPRYISELPTQLSNPASGETWTVTLVTLSVLGGCLEGRSIPDVGAQCQMTAEWEGKQLVVDGEVVWKTKGQAGVKFRSLGEGAEKLLRQVCASLRLQPLAPLPPQPN